jgi:hypothetical protein
VAAMTKAKYSGPHRRLSELLRAGAHGLPCVRCGEPMLPGQPLDLDHDDDHPGRYRGVAHASCNRSAGATKGNRQRTIPRRQIMSDTPAAYGIEISQDRAHTSIAAATDLEGCTVVELAAYLEGSDTAEQVAQLVGDKPIAVVIDPRSPAATLIAPLQALGIKVTEPSTSDLAVAHGLFLDALKAQRLRVVPHPALDTAAQHALARPLAGGEALDRRRPEQDTSPLTAAELAVWGLHRRPPRTGLFLAVT